MSNDQLSASEAKRRFAALRDEIDNGPPDKERRLEELDAILGPRNGDYDEIQLERSFSEVETNASLAANHPARERAATMVEELLDSPELRQALLPILMAEGPSVFRDWVFIWRELEDERRRLIYDPVTALETLREFADSLALP